MPFQIIRNDITLMCVDAIVNTANPRPRIGSGTDAGIHAKAGPKLLEARQKIGNIEVGHAALTKAYDLGAKYVIHTVGPIWVDGNHGEEENLRRCYAASLNLARRYRCKSIAFPLISAGNYGFPKSLALKNAIQVISDFLLEHEMQIYLVVFNRDAFHISERLFESVTSYIDDNYAQAKEAAECIRHSSIEELRTFQRSRLSEEWKGDTGVLPKGYPSVAEADFTVKAPAPSHAKKSSRLNDLLSQTDAGFTETLLKLIDKSGKKDSEIYKRANVTKQHFSKIRKNLDYKPTKATAVAFAIALELNLEQTKDLIGRAGFALTNSSKFDVIIMYFIDQGNYNMFDINSALFEFDQTLLGA